MKWHCSAFIAGMLAMAVSGCESSRIATVPRSARIVSLAPSVTETLFAIGVGTNVVGVSQYCDYPPQVRLLPKIGSFLTPNIEEIVALKPTLMIGLLTSSDLREIHALQRMGIATLMVDNDSVTSIEVSIEKIGNAVGRTQAAGELVARIRSRIGEMEERLA